MIHNKTKKGRKLFKSRRRGKSRRVQRGGAERHGEYRGYFNEDGVPHGQGKMIYANGDVYEGSWLNGIKQGKGKMIDADGDVYEGDWVNGKHHGHGFFGFSDGEGGFDETYNGQWENDKMHGRGIYRYPSGDVYDGNWADDKKNGEGKMTYANGDVYEGSWNDDFMHGPGKMTYANGDVYEGMWDASYKHGHGKMTYANGDVYEGPWHYGQRHGENGTMRYADGNVYDGEWWKDNMHGDGTLRASSGRVIHEGLWKNDIHIPFLFNPENGTLDDNDEYVPPARPMDFINSDNMLFTDDKIKHKYKFNDVIYNEEKNVVDELTEDPTTIALLLNRTYYVPSKERLIQLMNDRRWIRYACTKDDKADEFSIVADVDKTVPYFGLNGLVSNQGGVVPLFDLWAAINSGNRAFELIKTERKLLTVASHHVAYDYGSWVGSAHCQQDKGADIYELRILRIKEKPRPRNKTRRNSFRAHPYRLPSRHHPFYDPGR